MCLQLHFARTEALCARWLLHQQALRSHLNLQHHVNTLCTTLVSFQHHQSPESSSAGTLHLPTTGPVWPGSVPSARGGGAASSRAQSPAAVGRAPLVMALPPVWHFLRRLPSSPPVATPQTRQHTEPRVHSPLPAHTQPGTGTAAVCSRPGRSEARAERTHSPAFIGDGAAGWRSAAPIPARPPSSL